MDILKCSVYECRYNKANRCHKDCVCVGGHNASTSCETICESFVNKDSVTNSTDSINDGCLCHEIKCDADNCVYNCDCKCHATDVDVMCENGKICCNTFKLA